MNKCPEEFYNNCLHACFKCNICKAGKGNSRSKLHYMPIDETISPHPITLESKPKQSFSKSGRNTERKVAKDFIHTTINSGALLADGDIKVGDLNLDVKKRHNTSSFTVRKDEYRTMKSNPKIDGWVIVNKENDKVIMLTEKAFLKLTGKNYDYYT